MYKYLVILILIFIALFVYMNINYKKENFDDRKQKNNSFYMKMKGTRDSRVVS
jgi:hypothetical protein